MPNQELMVALGRVGKLNPNWKVEPDGHGAYFRSQHGIEIRLGYGTSGTSMQVVENLDQNGRTVIYQGVFTIQPLTDAVVDPETVQYLVRYIDAIAKPIITKQRADREEEVEQARRKFWRDKRE